MFPCEFKELQTAVTLTSFPSITASFNALSPSDLRLAFPVLLCYSSAGHRNPQSQHP